MTSKRLSWTTLMMLLLGVGLSRQADALANRVFVSARSGNDANACDNIATPCQTFAGAVLQLNPGGEAIVLDSGGYGPVTITQAVTIEAPPGVLAFIHPPFTDAVVINAGVSDTVILRGLVLNVGTVNGITVNTVGALHVENCVINGFVNNGIAFLAAGQLFVKDTIARNNGNAGIGITGSAGSPKGSLDRCRLEGNVIGLFVTRGSATIRDSVASGNTNGFYTASLVANPVELNIENCLAANNTSNGILSQAATATVRVSDTTVTDNATGVGQVGGGVMLSRGNNTVEGNTTTDGAFTGPFTAK